MLTTWQHWFLYPNLEFQFLKRQGFSIYFNISLLHTPQEYTSAVSEKDKLFYLEVESFKIF